MKIIYVNYEYPPLGGGGGVINKTLAEQISKNHDVYVLTSGNNNLSKKEVNDGLTVYRTPVLFRNSYTTASLSSLLTFPLSAVYQGLRITNNIHPDIIHSFFAVPSGLTGLYISKKYHLPHVLTIIGGDIYDPTKILSPHKNPFTRLIVNKIIKQANIVTSISKDIAIRASKYYNFDLQKRPIKIIPPGLKPPNYPQSSKKSSTQSRNKFVIVTIARLVKRKGLETLVKSVHTLPKHKIRLLIIGDGPERKNLEKLTETLKLKRVVKFLGFLELDSNKKYEVLSLADCFILPSIHEGFGYVFLEAMYFGLPIIASNVGGQIDLLENGKTGFLIPPHNIGAISNAILELINNKNLKQKMSKYNKNKIKSYYISKVAEKYEILYKSLLEENQ